MNCVSNNRLIRLVVSDIDGTALKSGNALAPELKSEIVRLSNCGIGFTFATGRLPYEMEMMFEGIPWTVPYAAANGAIIKDQNGYIKRNTFCPKHLRPLIRSFVSFVILLDINNPGYDRPLGDADSVWDQPVYRVKIVDPKKSGVIRKLADDLKANSCGVSVFQNGLDSIEIFSSEASKEDAIQEIASILGFTAEETLVIGSSESDIPGFLWAKQSVAIGNAHYKLKNEATYVADRKYACGVAEGIEHYFPEINIEHHCAIM